MIINVYIKPWILDTILYMTPIFGFVFGAMVARSYRKLWLWGLPGLLVGGGFKYPG